MARFQSGSTFYVNPTVVGASSDGFSNGDEVVISERGLLKMFFALSLFEAVFKVTQSVFQNP